MIILEGCDASGKTTLLNHLAERFKLAIVRSRGKPQTDIDIVRYNAWASSCPQPLILDRHPAISDLVYGPIIRGHSPAKPQYAQFVANTNFLVFCQPPLEVVKANIHNEVQMEGVAEKLDRLYLGYVALMETLSPRFIYDYTNRNHLSQLEEQVHDYLAATSRDL